MTTMPVTIQERVQPMMPHAGPGGGEVGGMTAGDVMRIFKQRFFLIVIISVLITGAFIGGTLYLAREMPKWRSVGAIYVYPPGDKAPMQFQHPTVAAELLDRAIKGEIERIKDDSVLRSILESSDVRSTRWAKDAQGNLRPVSDLLIELKKDLEVGQVPDSELIRVGFAAATPEEAKIIVQAVLDQYKNLIESQTILRHRDKIDQYLMQRTVLETQIANKRKDIRNKEEEFATPGMAQGLNITAEQYRVLVEQQTQLESEESFARSQYDQYRAMPRDEAGYVLSPVQKQLVEMDQQVVSLNNILRQFEQQYSFLRPKYGENHRVIRDLQRQIELYQAELEEVRSEQEREVLDYETYQAGMQYRNFQSAARDKQERILKVKADQEDLDKTYRELLDLEEELEQLLLQNKNVTDYLQMLEMARDEPENKAPAEIFANASLPLERHFPPSLYLTVPVGVFAGLALGFGLALLLELIDTSIRTPRDIVRHAHVPILGTVPDIDDEELEIKQVEMAVMTDPRSMTAEAFRSIRTNLLLSSPVERQRTVLITSARPEEGRTTIAMNLAMTLAQSGRRVLLVDANFHRPMLANFFPKAGREGLSNVLLGQSKVADLAVKTDLPNLDVLPTGPTPPNPTELLAGEYMQRMISEASANYDQIIFDGPPVLLVTDALVLAGAVDGIVMVCRARETSRGIVLRAREQLEQVGGRLFGAVLNAAQIRRGGYFREQIRNFYDYQPQDMVAGGASRALPPADDKKGKDDA